MHVMYFSVQVMSVTCSNMLSNTFANFQAAVVNLQTKWVYHTQNINAYSSRSENFFLASHSYIFDTCALTLSRKCMRAEIAYPSYVPL